MNNPSKSKTVPSDPIMDARIDKMFRTDVLWGWGFVIVLWIVYLYVFFHVTAVVSDTDVKNVLMVAGGLVLLFNTAAIFALVRHYSHEKDFIYGLDIRHIDENRRIKAAQQSSN